MISKTTFRLKKDRTPRKDCFCRTPELIENYDKAIADTTQTWDCHHRLETHNSDGERRSVDLTSVELIALDMYYDRPPEELIFMTSLDHKCLHNVGKPKPKSEETRKKMSEAHKGQVPWNKGKHLSEEQKRHLSEETRKKLSEAKKGKHWKLVDGKRVWY